MWTSKHKPLNNKPLYIGIVIAILVIAVGGGIDASHVFGKEATLPIQILVSVLAGLILGVSFISANTRMSIKELIC